MAAPSLAASGHVLPRVRVMFVNEGVEGASWTLATWQVLTSTGSVAAWLNRVLAAMAAAQPAVPAFAAALPASSWTVWMDGALVPQTHSVRLLRESDVLVARLDGAGAGAALPVHVAVGGHVGTTVGGGAGHLARAHVAAGGVATTVQAAPAPGSDGEDSNAPPEEISSTADGGRRARGSRGGARKQRAKSASAPVAPGDDASTSWSLADGAGGASAFAPAVGQKRKRPRTEDAPEQQRADGGSRGAGDTGLAVAWEPMPLTVDSLTGCRDTTVKVQWVKQGPAGFPLPCGPAVGVLVRVFTPTTPAELSEVEGIADDSAVGSCVRVRWQSTSLGQRQQSTIPISLLMSVQRARNSAARGDIVGGEGTGPVAGGAAAVDLHAPLPPTSPPYHPSSPPQAAVPSGASASASASDGDGDAFSSLGASATQSAATTGTGAGGTAGHGVSASGRGGVAGRGGRGGGARRIGAGGGMAGLLRRLTAEHAAAHSGAGGTDGEAATAAAVQAAGPVPS